MARVNNFGTAFNSTTFRTAIRDTMTMGLPGTVAERATFQWRTIASYADADTTNKPYSWDSTPVTEVTHPDVLVPVAVEFTQGRTPEYSSVGKLSPDRVVITILDVDFADIDGASHCLLGGDSYEIQFVAPPMGLFDVTIYQLHLVAVDES